MAKSKKRAEDKQRKRSKKKADYDRRIKDQDKDSNYARKKKFLLRHGGMGTDYPDKPWKKKS